MTEGEELKADHYYTQWGAIHAALDHVMNRHGIEASIRAEVYAKAEAAFQEHAWADSERYRQAANAKYRAFEKGEVWYWQGDGSDNPESLGCPALVEAEQVRAWAASEADNKRLAAIVGRLPKTADGVPVTIGMRVWPESLDDWQAPDGIMEEDRGGVVCAIKRNGEIEIEDLHAEMGPSYFEANASSVFSSRDASIAAREAKAKAGAGVKPGKDTP